MKVYAVEAKTWGRLDMQSGTLKMHFNRQRLNDSADDLAAIAADCDDLFGGRSSWKVINGSRKMA